jgi:hypothetical protein
MHRNVFLLRVAVTGALVLSAILCAGWKWDLAVL